MDDARGPGPTAPGGADAGHADSALADEARAPRSGAPAALLVALSALVLVAASARRTPGEAGAPAGGEGERAAGPGRPPPLPSGAAPRQALAALAESAGEGCTFPDRGFGEYEAWRDLPVGRALVPARIHDDGGFDLLVHFHGAEPIRKQLAVEDTGLVIAALDAGTLSSHYAQALPAPDAFDRMIASVEREVARATGRPAARAAHVAVSSWSAGYGAIAAILGHPHARVDAWVLLDSLHASFAPGGGRAPLGPQLAPFLDLAKAAAANGPLFYLTHSAVRTEGYASTTEVASFLSREVTGEAPPPPEAAPPEPGALHETRAVERGRFFVRGYAGDGKDAHCDELRLLPGIVREHVLPAFALGGPGP